MDRFLIISAVFLPALGLIAHCWKGPFFQQQNRRRLVCSLCVLAGMAAAGLMVVDFRANTPLTSVELFDWISIAAEKDLQIKFSLGISFQTAAFLCWSNLLACLLFALSKSTPLNLLQLVVINLLFVSENSVQTFFCWELISVGSFYLVKDDSIENTPNSAVFIFHVISDLCLLFAVMTLWKQASSFDFATILSSEIIQPVISESSHSINLAGTLIVLSAACRLTMLPLANHLNQSMKIDSMKTDSWKLAWLAGVVLVPSSVFLLLQFQPVILATTVSQNLFMFVGVVGVISAVWTALQVFGKLTAKTGRNTFEGILDSILVRPLQRTAVVIQWLERLILGRALPRLFDIVSISMEQILGVLKTGDVLFYALSVVLTAAVLVVVLVGMQG